MVGPLLALLLVMAAQAEEPDPEPLEHEVDDEGQVVHEIIVHGDLDVERARNALIHEVRREGYTTEIHRKNRVVFRHDEPWKGEIVLHDDGWARMKRQPMRWEAREVPWASKGSPLASVGCVIYPWYCLRVGGATVSRKKMMGQRRRVLAGLEPTLRAWGDRVADRAVDDTVDVVPFLLDELWYKGVAMGGDELPVQTVAERKRAILAYWESRTDNLWGNRVRAVVEIFVREEIQGGPDSFTVAEIAAFNLSRTSEREIDLWRSYDLVMADLDGVEAQ